jgi:RimJ/RimL family protein N-acetyltransferase
LWVLWQSWEGAARTGTEEIRMVGEQTTIFETARLCVRLANVEDAVLIQALWNDPRVMTYVGFPHGLGITLDQLREQYLRREGDEFERLLVVELKETGQPIGQCKMERPNDEGLVGPDLKLLPAFWGHRYGAEAWKAMVAYEFTHTGCDAVDGSPNVENVASIKMMAGAGAVRIDEGVYEFPEPMRDLTLPVHYYVYRLSREDWAAGSTSGGPPASSREPANDG